MSLCLVLKLNAAACTPTQTRIQFDKKNTMNVIKCEWECLKLQPKNKREENKKWFYALKYYQAIVSWDWDVVAGESNIYVTRTHPFHSYLLCFVVACIR